MEKILHRKTVFKGKVFNVQQISIELFPGEVVEWEIVDKGQFSIGILPITQDNKIILVEEYFGAIDKRILCLPKGSPEPNETFEETALREMQEEVGLIGNLKLLTTIEVSPSYLTQRTVIYLATDLKKQTAKGDEKEYLKPVYIDLDTSIEMIRDGRITEARTISAILMYKQFYA